MQLLTLYSGLLLPWISGTLWLIFSESRFNGNDQPNRLRQAGYGFFLGYAVLFLAIMTSNALTDRVSWSGVMLFFVLLTTGGGIALWSSRTAGRPTRLKPEEELPGSMEKLLIVLLLAWISLHLVFMVVEVFTQVLYPWDAWTVWVFRAKAWFLAGGMASIVSPDAWALANTADSYATASWRYPLLPSVVPYWAVLSLGYWSETLVNLPVLFVGLAIGMALYGQCREYGFGTATSLLCCYLLFSIPLFGTHIALAGYADIWMAGFAGPGFVALMRGTIRTGTGDKRLNFQLVLGLVMIGIGILIKNEGLVWLLAALLMLVLLSFRLRVLLWSASALVAIVFLLYTLGITSIQIPLIGAISYTGTQLTIPYIGSITLAAQNTWEPYLRNFFLMGNWNLLWLMVLASLLFAIRSPAQPENRSGLVFLAIFITMQVIIFGFSEQGLFAQDFTSINRLPLHFIPALLFASLVCIYPGHAGSTGHMLRWGQSPGHLDARLPIAVLLSFAVIFSCILIYLNRDLPGSTDESLTIPAASLVFAMGSGHPQDHDMVVDGFENGYALLSSGPVSVQAENVGTLHYHWKVSNSYQEAAFFWRRNDSAEGVSRIDLTVPGEHFVDLSAFADWQGEIVEVGFLVRDNTTAIGSAVLLPDSLGLRLRLVWQGWSTFEEWSQQSVHFLQGGDYDQVIPLPLLVVAWLLLTMVFLFLGSRFAQRGNTTSLLVNAGLLFVLAWMLLDVRWSSNNIRQITLSLQTQWQQDDHQRLSIGLDGKIYQYILRLKREVLGEQPARILIVGDETAIDYNLLRAKYHLLPHSVNVAGRFDRDLQPESLDFVIFFSQAPDITNTPGWNASWRRALIRIDHGVWGMVYRVNGAVGKGSQQR